MTYDDKEYNRSLPPTVIGNDVWVGAHAIVLGGVTVTDGCVVAASAVVTKNFEPFSIIGGIPARVIGRRSVDKSFVELVGKTDDINELRALAKHAREKSHLAFSHQSVEG
jgi:acetyltransferase-like isoleucine patch superfamily enzyme